MNATTNLKPAASPLHADLASVALIDAKTCAAVGQMCLSWWLAEVAAGRAPQPVVRRPRCTRWHLGTVAEYWIEFAKAGGADAESATKVMALAVNASAKAKAKREALKRAVEHGVAPTGGLA